MTILDSLLEHRLLYGSEPDGLYACGEPFERVVEALDAWLSAFMSEDGPEHISFPPVMRRADLERGGYTRKFPNLVGSISVFESASAQPHSGCCDSPLYGESDLVLTPAACYPVYPLLARRGEVPRGGWTIALRSYCYRREPSAEVTRWQAFRLREFVRVGTPGQIAQFRTAWVGRLGRMADTLDLSHQVEVANDPFFGRGARLLAAEQRERNMKLELLMQADDCADPAACASLNAHEDHFGRSFSLVTGDGGHAHTACVGFGLERMTLALFHRYGIDTQRWPKPIRAVLRLPE